MDIRSAGQKGDFGTAISGGMESTPTGLAVGTLNLQIAESDSSYPAEFMDIRSAGQKLDFKSAISGGMESTSTGVA